MVDKPKKIEYIKSLNPTERGVFADMIMRSLRGSWNRPHDRAKMLKWIGEVGELEYYDDDKLLSRAEGYIENIYDYYPDGRYWRNYYEEVDVDHSVVGESKLREMSSHIPDDLTWDDWGINRVFEKQRKEITDRNLKFLAGMLWATYEKAQKCIPAEELKGQGSAIPDDRIEEALDMCVEEGYIRKTPDGYVPLPERES